MWSSACYCRKGLRKNKVVPVAVSVVLPGEWSRLRLERELRTGATGKTRGWGGMGGKPDRRRRKARKKQTGWLKGKRLKQTHCRFWPILYLVVLFFCCVFPE